MKNKNRKPGLIVPPGMARWVEKEAEKLGLIFMGEVREIDPTAPGHDVENEISILASSTYPSLHSV